MKESILKEKSFSFATRIVQLCMYLRKEKAAFVLSNQILRCGTSIGAVIREAEYAESLKDFVHKLSISLKEANECKYWLELLFATDYLTNELYQSLEKDCTELLKLLTASIRTVKQKLNKSLPQSNP
jgi:four helix bundle protein